MTARRAAMALAIVAGAIASLAHAEEVEMRVDRMVRLRQPVHENGRVVWEYDLTVREQRHRLVDGTEYKVWAFGGSIPGPMLIAREGDWVRIRLTNETSVAHTIHSHGLFVPHRMDGAPHVHVGPVVAQGRPEDTRGVTDQAAHLHAGSAGGAAQGEALPPWASPVPPGATFTYEYIARPSGTHFYHCHANASEHLDRGMSGALVVLPRRPDPPVDADVVFLLDEWNTKYADGGIPGHPREVGDYDIFTINGRSYPDISPVQVRVGDVVRVRFINAGAQQHFMHLHGHQFLVTHKDGQPLPHVASMDTVAVGPGERVDIVFVANNPGDWPMHCHTVAHVTNAGHYPGGMMVHFLVGAERYPAVGEGPTGPGVQRIWPAWSALGRRSR